MSGYAREHPEEFYQEDGPEAYSQGQCRSRSEKRTACELDGPHPDEAHVDENGYRWSL